MKSFFYIFVFLVFVVPFSAKAAFQDLPADEQKQALDNYQRFQGLSSEQKQALQKSYDHYQTLSPAEKKQVESRFAQIKNLPKDRQAWAYSRGKYRAQKSTRSKSKSSTKKRKTAKT